MLDNTVEIVKLGLKQDPTISPIERTRLLKLLRQAENEDPKPETPLPPKVLRRKEAAARLGRSLRFVDKLAACGTLRRITLPGRRRAIGFAEADITALIAGAFAE
jgi:hypothetical protein